jgi:YVTN family beta-propeller protein
MDYRILGPLEVADGGRSVALGGDKQRALLAILVLHRNQVVSADRLIDGLWGESPPASALRTLQAYVSRLRRALSANGAASVAPDFSPAGGSGDGALLTRGHGYLLAVAPGELDLDRFGELVEQGRDALAVGMPEEAARVLREGLGLWRGPPLADFAYEPFAQAAIAQLEELRLGAVEERIEADLARGRARELVGELRDLVEEHPLRERLRGQLMLALYRSGRQAEALEVYQEFRRALSQQLGLDPGPGLQELELGILARDPALAARSHNGESIGVTNPSPLAPREAVARRRRRLAVGALGLVALVLAGVILALGLDRGGAPRSLVADSVGAISPSAGAIGADVPVGSSPSAMASGAGALWVSNYNAGTVSRIDPAAHELVQTISAGQTPSGIAVGAGSVWVANYIPGTVLRINPAVNSVVGQPIPVGNGPTGVAVGYGSVWVTNSSDGTLSRIDAIRGTVTDKIPLGGDSTRVAVGFGAVWVSDAVDGRVLEINPQTDQVAHVIGVGTGPGAITAGYRSVWVANSLDGTVSRIDPQTSQVEASVPVGKGPDAIAAGPGGVWVANEYGGNVARIDPTTDTVARTVAVANPPTALAINSGLVWAGVQASAAIHRGGTLTVLSSAPFGSIDPAFAGQVAAPLTLVMTNDGLTAFRRVGGSDGDELVPDLAVSLPTPTDGGRTYTFRLRPAIRYSNGQPVRPEDFRRAIERAIADPHLHEIVGAPACAARPAAPCDLSQGIVTDDAADTVTFHLVAPDPDFLSALTVWDAFAVPAKTPFHDLGSHPLPATGPYEVASVTRRQVVLVRNPYFHEWSHPAQPDGYPDRIVWRVGASVENAVTEVERGQADYTLDGPPPDRLNEVQTRFASQLHVTIDDVVIGLGLNTQVAPFNDIRVRRALNYAVDRAKLAQLLGQASRPTCQNLPPDVLGYQPYCPYTLNRDRAGAWSWPDLATARRLIAASGTRGTPITIWSGPGYMTPDFTPAARYLASLLDRLGYPTRVRTFSATSNWFSAASDSRAKVQAFDFVTVGPYPSPSVYIGPDYTSCQSLVRNSQNNPNAYEFCDPRFDATVRSARAAQDVGSPVAYALWARADRQYTDDAPVVNLDTPSITDFVSHRVGNYQYNPALGVLIDQLWVR